MPSPIILWNAETNAPESVEPAEAREKLASGKYTEFTAGRTSLGATQRAVDLTASDGNSLDRILLGEAASVDPYAEANAASQDFREARYDTARDKIKTFGEGIVDSMSLGLVESLTDDFGGDQRRDVLSGYNTAGQLVGIAGSIGAPVAPLGALSKGAAAVGGNVAARLGGGAAGRIVGAGVEGALFGLADETAHQTFDAVIRDRPFVAERLASAASMGGLVGLGSTALLEGAAKVVAAAKGSSKDVANAVLTKEARAEIGSNVKAAHDAMGATIDDMAGRLRVLEVARAEAKAGLNGVADTAEGQFIAGLDDTWFATRKAAVKEAEKARKQLARFNPEKVLELDKAGLKAYSKQWAKYEGAVSKLDEVLRLPPKGFEAARPAVSLSNDFLNADTRVLGRGGAAADVTRVIRHQTPRSPFYRQFLDDWFNSGSSRSSLAAGFDDLAVGPIAELSGKLSNSAKAITDATEMAGNLPAITGRLGVEGIRGQSAYTDSLIDTWAAAQFAKAVGDEASGAGSFLRKGGERESQVPWHKRRVAELARYTARREMGGDYGGFIAGQAAYAIVAGKLGRLLGWADEAKTAAASAVESLLKGGRAMATTKLLTAAKVSYTGRDEDKTDDPLVKGEQLRNMVSNEEALRQRIRKDLAPIAKASPDLATEMENVQVSRLRNLAMKAPAFLALPGAVPPKPYGPQFDYYNDYEAVTLDPNNAIEALKTNSLTQAKADALREQHPQLAAYIAKAVVGGLSAKQMLAMSKQSRQQVEMLLGYPLFPTVGPAQQASYAKVKERAQQTGDGGPPNPRAMPRPSMGSQMTAPLTRPGR